MQSSSFPSFSSLPSFSSFPSISSFTGISSFPGYSTVVDIYHSYYPEELNNQSQPDSTVLTESERQELAKQRELDNQFLAISDRESKGLYFSTLALYASVIEKDPPRAEFQFKAMLATVAKEEEKRRAELLSLSASDSELGKIVTVSMIYDSCLQRERLRLTESLPSKNISGFEQLLRLMPKPEGSENIHSRRNKVDKRSLAPKHAKENVPPKAIENLLNDSSSSSEEENVVPHVEGHYANSTTNRLIQSKQRAPKTIENLSNDSSSSSEEENVIPHISGQGHYANSTTTKLIKSKQRPLGDCSNTVDKRTLARRNVKENFLNVISSGTEKENVIPHISGQGHYANSTTTKLIKSKQRPLGDCSNNKHAGNRIRSS